MSFPSILFEKPEDRQVEQQPEAPIFLVDLHLDQIIADLTKRKEEYDLEPYYHLPLSTADAIEYRQNVMKDLEDAALLDSVKTLAQRMRTVRTHLAQASDKLYYKFQKEAWFLDGVEIYCDAVMDFAGALSRAPLTSRGFLDVRKYLSAYVASDRFTALLSETKQLKADLIEVRYCVLIKGDRVTVRSYEL
jgi:DNA mismatch repair protein MutS